MTHDVRISLAKIGITLSVLVALVILTSAFKGWLTEQYVPRSEYAIDIAQIKADLALIRADSRVLRCKVAKDC